MEKPLKITEQDTPPSQTSLPEVTKHQEEPAKREELR